MARHIAWCKSHYRNDFAKEKAKELREQGYKVKLGAYLKEDGQSYCKIYLNKDLNYHLLHMLDMIHFRITNNKEGIRKAVRRERDNIKTLCHRYEKRIRIEYDGDNLVAVIGDYEKELYKPLATMNFS